MTKVLFEENSQLPLKNIRAFFSYVVRMEEFPSIKLIGVIAPT